MPRKFNNLGETPCPAECVTRPRRPGGATTDASHFMLSGAAIEAETVAVRAERNDPCAERNDPCNVRCIAMIRCRVLSCLSLRGRCGRRQSKQEFLRRCRRDVRRCARMGLSPAWRFTAKPGRPILMRRADALAHVPSACIGVHLPASALNPCLRRRMPHQAARLPGPDPPARTMHQFPHLPPLRRPSGPETDLIDVLPEPLAPIRPPFRQARTARGGQNPIHHAQSPDRRCPPSRPESAWPTFMLTNCR